MIMNTKKKLSKHEQRNEDVYELLKRLVCSIELQTQLLAKSVDIMSELNESRKLKGKLL